MRAGPDPQHVMMSTLRKPTPEEIRIAEELHAQGKCPHTIVYDKQGWMYDTRYCGTCGICLGLI